MPPRHEELTGVYRRTRNVFQDDDPEERTVIAELDDANATTVKGRAAHGDLESGLTYRFLGRWVTHPVYGRQFHFTSFALAAPSGERATIKYLARGPGIGNARARQIWRAFGEQSLEVCRTEPHEIAATVKGIDADQADEIAVYFRQFEKLERVTIEVNDLLAGKGFPRSLPDKVIKAWGMAAPSVIRNTPYKLMQFRGAGFQTADRLYLEQGHDPAAIERQAYCLHHAMATSGDGSTWHTLPQLAVQLRQAISTGRPCMDAAIEWGVRNCLITTHKDRAGNVTHLAQLDNAVAEQRLAEGVWEAIRHGETGTPRWPDMSGYTTAFDGREEIPRLTIHQAEQSALAMRGFIGLLCGSPGTGKAQPLDAKILTPTGWTTMRDIQQGDAVIGGNGKPTTVTGTYDRGTLSVYRVTLSDGTWTECSADHLWHTTTRKERQCHKPGATRTTIDIAATLDRGDGSMTNHQIPTVGPVEFSKSELPISPYLLGILLGDGCFIGGYAKVSAPDEFIVEQVKSMLPQEVCLKQTSSLIDYRITGNGGANTFTQSLRTLGLMEKLSVEKHIPDSYLFASQTDRLALLQGLLDTDATTDGHNIEFSTSSPLLASDIEFLVHSFGGCVTTKTRTPKYKYNGETRCGALSYRILVRLPASIAPFRLPRKRDRYIPRSKYPPRRYVVSVDYVAHRPCRCISVENQDGLYVTNNCIVTHNTFTLAQILRAIQSQEGSARIAVAAPTGKAAVRATESLAAQGITMTATTIHRLLGVARANEQEGDRETGWGFNHDESNPLPLDFLFIDEASMVDTTLAASLFAAVPTGCHVLLIGDPDQLAPVGHGAPLRDLIAAGLPKGHLTEIMRNAGRIVRSCAEIRDKQRCTFSPSLILNQEQPENLVLSVAIEAESAIERLEQVINGAATIGRPCMDGEPHRDRVWDVQVVVPVNDKSPLARKALNRHLQQLLNPDGESMDGIDFRVGDKVCCLKNGTYAMLDGDVETEPQAVVVKPKGSRYSVDSLRGRFNHTNNAKPSECYVANGELAKVTEIAAGYIILELASPRRVVRVPRGASADGESGGGSVGNFDLAYALSVHKSQGSEWPVVIIMADAYGGARRVMDRHWVYTAISRAKEYAVCIGQRKIIDAAIRQSYMWQRKTFLKETIDAMHLDAALCFMD